MAAQFDNIKTSMTRLQAKAHQLLHLWKTRSYEELSQERAEGKFGEETQSLPPEVGPSTQSRTIRYIAASGTFLLALIAIPISLIRHRSNPQWQSCGDNLETARQRGCSFDLITFAWQMPNCHDAPLVDEFADWEHWTFWTNEHGKGIGSFGFLGSTMWYTVHLFGGRCTGHMRPVGSTSTPGVITTRPIVRSCS
ncbi:hypothetical protein ACEPPN_007999 [Leptodophora sp. 'Broadleaf-Isolate-01']